VYKKNISTAASYLVDSVSDYCFRPTDVYMKFVLGVAEDMLLRPPRIAHQYR
jgi:hypothetical protein